MTITLNKRHLLIGAGGLVLATLALLLVARQALTALAVNALLQLGGASEIAFTITEATPWRVVVEDIGFQVRAQKFAAKRVSFIRKHWWAPSLGTVRVEQASVPLAMDGAPSGSPPASTGGGGLPVIPSADIPADEIHIDGRLVLQAAGLPDQVLEVTFQAHSADNLVWLAGVTVKGPGLLAGAGASYLKSDAAVDFQVHSAELDLKAWQAFGQRLVPLPDGLWTVEGKFTGRAEGRWADRQLNTSGTVRLREGRAVDPLGTVTAEGIEADLEFTDFAQVITKPGTLRVREVRTGQLALRDLDAEVALAGTNKIAVGRVSFQVLGGTVAAEPFNFVPSLGEVETVVLVDGINIEEVMALTRDLPARAVGRVNGRFPLRLDAGGLRLGTGWLQLKPGVYAEIQFNASGLLTGGASPSSPGYAVLKKVESGLLKLKISELRLDIRPPNAPAGRSAQLHIAGEPVDPDVKAPVILDLNVNGPLEKLINLGLDSRLSFGSKP